MVTHQRVLKSHIQLPSYHSRIPRWPHCGGQDLQRRRTMASNSKILQLFSVQHLLHSTRLHQRQLWPDFADIMTKQSPGIVHFLLPAGPIGDHFSNQMVGPGDRNNFVSTSLPPFPSWGLCTIQISPKWAQIANLQIMHLWLGGVVGKILGHRIWIWDLEGVLKIT